MPGNQSCSIWKLGKTKKSKDGQKGMISTLAMSMSQDHENILAVGTRNPSSIYLYDDRMGYSNEMGEIHTLSASFGRVGSSSSHVILGHGKHFSRKRKWTTTLHPTTETERQSQQQQQDDESKDIQDIFSMAKQKLYQQTAKGTGINQLVFGSGAQNSHLLYSSARKSNAVLAWDLRMLSSSSSSSSSSLSSKTFLFQTTPQAFPRTGEFTNQTLQFHVDHHQNRLYAPSTTMNNNDSDNNYNRTDVNHSIHVYNASTGECVDQWNGLEDVPNGVSISPINSYMNNPNDQNTSGGSIMAVSYGARRFEDFWNNNDHDGEDDDEKKEVKCSTKPPSGKLAFYSIP